MHFTEECLFALVLMSVATAGVLFLYVFLLASSSVVMFVVNFLLGKFFEAVSRFNSNVAYSGLLHAVTQDVSYLSVIVYHII